MAVLNRISITLALILTSSQCLAVPTITETITAATITQSNAFAYANASGQTQGFVLIIAPNTNSSYYSSSNNTNNANVSTAYGNADFLQNLFGANMPSPLQWYYLNNGFNIGY